MWNMKEEKKITYLASGRVHSETLGQVLGIYGLLKKFRLALIVSISRVALASEWLGK